MTTGLYQHYKGKYYVMTDVGIHTETAEDLVSYFELEHPNVVWFRPYHMFYENVEVDGLEVPRFKLIFKIDFQKRDWKKLVEPYLKHPEFVPPKGFLDSPIETVWDRLKALVGL